MICPRVSPLIWGHKSWQRIPTMWGVPCHCDLNFQRRIRISVLPFEVLHTWKHVGEEFAATAPGKLESHFVSFVFLQSLAPGSSSESPERWKDGCVVHLRVTTAVWNKEERSVRAPSAVHMGAPAGWPTLCSSVLIPSAVSPSSAHDTFSQPRHPPNICLGSGARTSPGHQSVDSYPLP